MSIAQPGLTTVLGEVAGFPAIVARVTGKRKLLWWSDCHLLLLCWWSAVSCTAATAAAVGDCPRTVVEGGAAVP
jgi:hypothetical protein